MISAQIAIAVSSGVRAPTSSPIGDCTRSISASLEAGLAQPLDSTLVRAARAHRAEIADPRLHRGRDRGNVELVVVREHADRVARAEIVAHLREIAIGPVVDDFVGHREPLHGREHRARVAHGHAVPEQLGDLDQSGGEVDRAEDDHARRLRERLDEDADDFLAGFAVRAVVAGRGEAGLELAERVARDDAVEVGIAERALRRSVDAHEQLGTDVRAVDDGRQRDRCLVAQRVAQRVVDRHQSNGSTKRWIVPPHVSPTANASSSE